MNSKQSTSNRSHTHTLLLIVVKRRDHTTHRLLQHQGTHRPMQPSLLHGLSHLCELAEETIGRRLCALLHVTTPPRVLQELMNRGDVQQTLKDCIHIAAVPHILKSTGRGTGVRRIRRARRISLVQRRPNRVPWRNRTLCSQRGSFQEATSPAANSIDRRCDLLSAHRTSLRLTGSTGAKHRHN